jgi:hypothetical protein
MVETKTRSSNSTFHDRFKTVSLTVSTNYHITPSILEYNNKKKVR